MTPICAYSFDFSAPGYFRNRIVAYHDLDTQKPSTVNQGGLGDNDRFGSMLFTQHRLRLDPTLKLNDNISIHSQFDILDNVIAGTEETKQIDFLSPIVGTIQLPGAGGTIGTAGGEAGENKALNVRRVYMDLLTPGGKFRIGRQPSHWGLGIFQHGGNGPYDDFGDSADRLLWLAGVEKEGIGMFSLGLSADVAFTKQTDPRVSGLGGAFTNPPEDMRQFAGILIYEWEEFFTLGTFAGVRYRNGVEGETTTTARPVLVDGNGDQILDVNDNSQLGEPIPAGKDGNTLIRFGDLYLAMGDGPWKLQGEFAVMTGKLATGLAVDAIPFNNLPANARGPIEVPSSGNENSLLVYMGAAELKGNYDFGEFLFQGGYASGDSQPMSSRITQFGFRPDYQIAMLLFHAPLGTSPRITQVNGNGSGGRTLVGSVPITGNFINNAAYGTFGYWHRLNLDRLVPKAGPAKVGVKVISAWAPANNYDIDFSQMIGISDLPHVVQSQKWYGIEFDQNLEARFFDHFLFNLTGGILIPGQAYDVQADLLINPSNAAGIHAITPDPANWVWGVRTNLVAEF
ncbi:MAG: hypothetical protein HY542_04725 [Deltaproteobacteria bacterium]|nr:hypothetical protein [Deltaproteobacteria bacterium]